LIQNLTDSRVANLGAKAISDAFDDYQTRFKNITRLAQVRFENRDWRGMQADAAERLDLYRLVIDRLVADVRYLLLDRLYDKIVWASMKAVYSGLIADRDDWELAETFFNSVTRRIFATVGVDQQIEFVDTDFDTPPTQTRNPIFRTYLRSGSIAELIQTILRDYGFRADYQDLARDTYLVTEEIEKHLRANGGWVDVERAEVVKPLFFRGKGAYIVGRLCHGEHITPLVLALLNTAQGVNVDAALLAEDEVSHLFGFTRSYFHVQADRPYDLTHFMKSILPRKRLAELYISIGYNKHGKTELYRDLLHHLAHARDKFEIARGEHGMVMIVFTLPSYDVVFKIIRDRFPDPKTISRQGVMDKYKLVFRHDRAGRLVDAQEFEHLQFDCDRFSEPLLDELRRSAANTVTIADDYVDVKHLYVERRLTPLNLHLHECADGACEAAVIDYGNAIKDLARANIFPGDILLKNFGLTRQGRVVFYDYDELTLLTDCNFRALPQPHDEDEELSGEAWFYVGENDFFPEEFRTWLGLAQPWRDVFMRHHGDLFELDFWRDIQRRIQAGEIMHIFPYAQRKRLHPEVNVD
jgi:isocitrate dehydrogenase kinase/phosphatase